MNLFLRVAAAVALAGAASACSVSSLLGGGGKVPATLLTLTPSAPAPAAIARSANAGEAVTISVPVIPDALRTTRVPAYVNATDIAYIQDLQWVDTPGELFQDLIAETVTRTTSRVVLDPNQAALDPGLLVTGKLMRMGYDAQRGAVVVSYDAALSTQGGTQVQTRRFEAEASADGTAATVGPALNQAANQVAMQVAGWIGG